MSAAAAFFLAHSEWGSQNGRAVCGAIATPISFHLPINKKKGRVSHFFYYLEAMSANKKQAPFGRRCQRVLCFHALLLLLVGRSLAFARS
jgi:hypothetical protein